MEITANDEPTEIEADVDKRFSSIIVNLPVQQTGTGTPSPTNPRPFTMWTDVSLYVSDTEEADEPTLAIELPTPMYGGKVDMVRGEIATTYNSKESGTGWEMTEEGQFRCQVSAYNNGDETSTDVADLYAVHYETVSNKDAYDATDDLTCGLATIAGTTYLYVNDAQYTTLESFTTHIADEVFVFRAHIPMSDVTEPHIVYLPEGTSYVWADAGFVDLTVSGTPPLSLPNSLGKPLKAWSVDLLPYQEGTGDPSPSNVRPIHGTDKVTITTAGKNLLNDSNASPVTQSGVTFTPNSDGTITVNGTATQNINYFITNNDGIDIPNGSYVISGCPSGGGSTTYRLRTDNLNGQVRGNDTGNGATFTIADGKLYATFITVWSGTTCNNLVFHPQICLASAPNPTEFVPYLAPSQTVITLPQTVYTGTIGSDGGESRWGVVDLGDLAWEYIGSSKKYFQTNSIKNIVKPPVTGSTVVDAMCEAYKMVSWNATTYATGLMAIAGADNPDPGRLSCINTNYTDVASFAAAMQGIKLVFELKTPTTFAVPSVTIPTPKGTATTWATAEDGTVDSMEVTYVGKA